MPIGNLNENHLMITSEKTGIRPQFLRKDYYVTKAIACISTLEDEYFSLIFQGGTSLTKAHQVVERFSEDIDFRIIYKSTDKILTSTGQRKRLSDLRKKIVHLLNDNGFDISKEKHGGSHKNQHMFIRATFREISLKKALVKFTNPYMQEVPSIEYDLQHDAYIKPHIQLDFYFNVMELPTENKTGSTLIKKTLGNLSEHSHFNITCLSLDETAAEKWLALIRRIFESIEKTRNGDRDLVRHIYDLHQLYMSSLLQEDKRFIIKNVLEKESDVYMDRQTFVNHMPRFIAEIAMKELKNNVIWGNHWREFLKKMVYGNIKPDYFEALSIIQQMTEEYLTILEQDLA